MQGRRCVAIALLIVLALVTTVGGVMALHYHKNSDALWQIVSQRCVPAQLQKNSPQPCLQVNLQDGYVVLKDRDGPLQLLLLPVAEINGIESQQLLNPLTPNFFAEAWRVRYFMAPRLGSTIDQRVYALAINSRWGRSQNQLHIHISCLRPDIRQQLDALNATLDDRWQRHRLGQHDYQLRVVSADEMKRTSPFIRIARELPDARDQMGSYGIAVAALDHKRQVLMVVKRDWLQLNLASAEELQDHSCALLRASGRIPPARDYN